MAVDLYLACRDCSCAEHTQLNARHEVAESLCDLGWSEAFGPTARGWFEAYPELGLESEPARAILGFAEVHSGHVLGIVGADDLFSWPWRMEREALPTQEALEAALGAKGNAEREAAARLARYRDRPELIEPLLRVLGRDRASSVRAVAAWSLASLANSQRHEGEALAPILSALSAALEHPKAPVRAAVAESFQLLVSGRPGGHDVYAVLVERGEALRDTVAALLERALEAEDAPRPELLRALGSCARPRSAGAILASLRSEVAEDKQAGIQALRALADAGSLPLEFADQLLGLAEEELEKDPSFAIQQSWGQVLLACGPIGVRTLKRLYRTRGLCYFAAQAALCGSAHLRDPLVGPEGRVPRRRADAKPEHLRLLPAPSAAHSGPRPESYLELDLAGELLVAQRGDGLSVIWNLAEGRVVRELWHEAEASLRRRDPARWVALSPAGEALATGTAKGQVRLWSVAEGELLREFEAAGCSRLRFGAQGALLYVGTPSGVVAWEVATGELQRRYPVQHRCDVVAARLDPAGERLATCGRTTQRRPDPEVHLLRRSGAHLLSLTHEGGVLDLAWSPCGTKLATLTEKRSLVIWSGGGRRLEEHATPAGAKVVAWPEAEAIVVSGAGKQLFVLRGSARSEEGPHGAAFAGEELAGVQRWVMGGSKGEVTLEVAGRTRELASGGTRQAALACGGGLVATLASTGTESLLRWWGEGEEHAEARLPDPTGYLVAISPEGSRLAACGQRWLICVEATSGEELWRREGKFYELGSLEFSPDGLRLFVPHKEDSLSRTPGWVEVLDAAEGTPLRRLGGVQDPRAFEVAEDQRRLVTGGAWLTPRGQLPLAGPALVWDLESGELLHVLRDPSPASGPPGQESRQVVAASLDPSGRLLASAGREVVLLWELEGEEPRWRAELPEAVGRASGVSFDPQGERLAVGTSLDHVLVFDVASGAELLRVSRAGEARGFPPAIAPRFLGDGRLVWGRLELEVFDLPAALAERPEATRKAAPELPAPSTSGATLWGTLAGDVSGLAASEEALFAASSEGEVVAFELGDLDGQGNERWRERPFPHGVRALALSQSGTWLACAGWGGELELFDVSNGERVQTLERAGTWIRELGFLGEDQLWGVLDPGLAGPWNTSAIGVWDLASGQRVLATTGTCAASAGERFAVGARDARFNAPLYSEEPLQIQLAKRNQVPAPVALFSGASLRWEGLLELPAPQGGELPSLPPLGPGESRGGQRALAFSPGGETLAIARDEPGLSDLVLLEVDALGKGGAKIVPTGRVDLLAWRADGRALACALGGGEAAFVDLRGQDMTPLGTRVKGCTALTWVGERLVIGTEEGHLWTL